MKLRMTLGGLIAEDTLRGRWARLPEHDAPETADPAEAESPLRPRSMRATGRR